MASRSGVHVRSISGGLASRGSRRRAIAGDGGWLVELRGRVIAIPPSNTVQMGHWADELLPDVKQELGIGGGEQDERLLAYLRQAQARVELLSGRAFGGVHDLMLHFKPAMPFVEVPDLRGQPRSTTAACWPVSDPVHPEIATVLQVAVFETVGKGAAPRAVALQAAGHLLAACIADARFADAVWQWLAQQRTADPSDELARALIDPNIYVQVPIAAIEVGGWWVQISRRLRLITKESPEDHRLVEPLLPIGDWAVMTASEPTLIVARLTEQPVAWAMAVRIWMVAGSQTSASWRLKGFAKTIHTHGLPIVSVDDSTTPDEAAAQLLLAAYWHGYLAGEEAAVPPALLRAFPREVASVRRGTRALDDVAAATLLFERLLKPGFDPARSAGTIRHYVRKHASTIVRAHRTSEAPSHPWDDLGINERYYYKLLRKFAMKTLDVRYDVDEGTIAQMRGYLKTRARRAAALELLRRRGFGDAAARKWLQRHEIASIRTAAPRRPRTGR